MKIRFFKRTLVSLMTLTALFIANNRLSAEQPTASPQEKKAMIGAFYFDGWASHTNCLMNNPDEPWAKDGPHHLSRRLAKEFPEREPIWGWHDDKLDLMERQIDLASDNGIEVFAFCWYMQGNVQTGFNAEKADTDTHHTGMHLFRKAANKDKMKYCMVPCGLPTENNEKIYTDIIKYWAKYFKDPQYLRINGKPVIMPFGSPSSEKMCAVMQAAAREEGFKDGLTIVNTNAARGKAGYDIDGDYNGALGYQAGSEAHPYQELIDDTKKKWKGSPKRPFFPTVHAGADYRPWEGPEGNFSSYGRPGNPPSWYFPDNTPEKFKEYLKAAVQWVNDNPTQTLKEKLVMIYAWNEIGEGGYLVPTKEDPDAAKLKVIKEVLEEK